MHVQHQRLAPQVRDLDYLAAGSVAQRLVDRIHVKALAVEPAMHLRARQLVAEKLLFQRIGLRWAARLGERMWGAAATGNDAHARRRYHRPAASAQRLTL